MEQLQCVICHEQPLFPVRLRCFHPGYTKSCDSFSLLCAPCADQYLRLDPIIRRASNVRKCLYCDVTCDVVHMSRDECYEKQYILMKMDPKKYSCPRCHEAEDVQLDLDHHYYDQCPLRPIQCDHCPFICAAREMAFHQKECSGFRNCIYCHHPIPIKDFAHHMVLKHDRRQCKLCLKWIAKRNVESHLKSRCRHEEDCYICHEHLKANKIIHHFSIHQRMVQQEISQFESLIEFMDHRRQFIQSSRFNTERRQHVASIRSRIKMIEMIQQKYMP